VTRIHAAHTVVVVGPLSHHKMVGTHMQNPYSGSRFWHIWYRCL